MFTNVKHFKHFIQRIKCNNELVYGQGGFNSSYDPLLSPTLLQTSTATNLRYAPMTFYANVIIAQYNKNFVNRFIARIPLEWIKRDTTHQTI